MKQIYLILFTVVLLCGCAGSTQVANRECEIVGNREPPLLVCDQQAPQVP